MKNEDIEPNKTILQHLQQSDAVAAVAVVKVAWPGCGNNERTPLQYPASGPSTTTAASKVTRLHSLPGTHAAGLLPLCQKAFVCHCFDARPVG